MIVLVAVDRVGWEQRETALNVRVIKNTSR